MVSAFLAIFEISIIALFGVIAFHLGFLSKDDTKHLGALVVNITYPLLIFTNMLKKFPSVASTPLWYILPLLNLALIGGSVLLSFFIAKRVLWIENKKEFVMTSGFQNGAYLPLILVASLFPSDISSKIFVYIFLFCMFYGVTIITFARYIFSAKGELSFKALLNPPLISLIIALSMVYLGIDTKIPHFLFSAFERIGNITIPLTLFVLGGSLYFSFIERTPINYPYALLSAFIKLVLIPIIVLFMVVITPMPSYMKFMLVMEASMPTAFSVTMYTRVFGGRYKLVSQTTLVIYLLSLVTLPIFTLLALKVSGI